MFWPCGKLFIVFFVVKLSMDVDVYKILFECRWKYLVYTLSIWANEFLGYLNTLIISTQNVALQKHNHILYFTKSGWMAQYSSHISGCILHWPFGSHCIMKNKIIGHFAWLKGFLANIATWRVGLLKCVTFSIFMYALSDTLQCWQ